MNPVIKPINIVLKEARQNKGVSFDEVTKVTKIHHNILRALEEGTTLGLSHVYVKSYIKIYAKYLGIDQKELDKYFHPVVPKDKKPPLDFYAKAKGIRIKALSKLPFLTSIHLQFKRFKKFAGIILACLVLLILLIGLIKGSARKDTVVLEKVTINGASTVAPAEQPKSEEKPKQVKQAVPPPVGDLLKLTIFAKLDTWMQIKVDGGVVYKRILKKAHSETWQAKESLELWIANAGTIDIELNGKTLEPLGKRGQLLRSVFITKEGIVIKK